MNQNSQLTNNVLTDLEIYKFLWHSVESIDFLYSKIQKIKIFHFLCSFELEGTT